METNKIVVCGSGYSSLDIEKEIIQKQGWCLIDAGNAEGNSLIEIVSDADALIVGSTVINKTIITRMNKCKVIVEYGIGVDNIDVLAASDAGIVIANVPGYGTVEVADHSVALLLALARKICLLDRAVRDGKWTTATCAKASLIEPAMPIYRLAGKTAGILGLGRIGSAVARRLQGFDMKVVGYDPYVSQEAMAKERVELADLDEVIVAADFICLHLPLTPETKGIITEARFRMMKKTAFFINLARGLIVDETALIRALKEGWIAGAGLDVLTMHPPSLDNPLLTMDNVIITPHTAWYSEEAEKNLRARASQEVVRVLTGREAESWVNKAHMKR